MFKFVKHLMADESGASGTEYIILLALVGAAVFAGYGLFGTAFHGLMTTLTADMAAWIT
jgi:Flp pilus assembly pilin Flp